MNATAAPPREFLRNTSTLLALTLVALAAGWTPVASSGAAEPADPLIQGFGTAGGICALPGDTGCALALKLARQTSLLL